MQDTVAIQTHQDFIFILLGSPEDKAIVLNSSRMKSLEKTIDSILNKDLAGVKGVIFRAPHNMSFCVGADINAIKTVKNVNEGKQLAEQGQRIFNKIEKISIPTFAAIQGHCVGGGCELALACDFRIISSDDKSKIGLPETKLGILPGFGGTQRLPKLIGLPKAIDFIVNAKVVPGKSALKLGLVDGLIQSKSDSITNDDIIDTCSILLSNKKISKVSFTDKLLTHTSVGRKLVESRSNKIALSKTKGHYPAIPLAIKSTLNAFSLPEKIAYQKEAEYLGNLICSKECKSLVHIFFLTEFASKIGKKISSKLELNHLGLIGAGVMGKGIASVAIKSKLTVTVLDTNPDSLTSLKDHVKNFLGQSKSLNDTDKAKLLENLKVTSNSSDLSKCDIIIEAATENLEIKKKIFSSLMKEENQTKMFATNTSSLTLESIFSSSEMKDICLGIHFFNPVEKMPLIEIIRDKFTADQIALYACAFGSKLGKYPVIVEDVPGFLVNRILAPYLAEASQLALEGAGIENIEKAILDFGFPMGPFRLLDEVGLDIAAKVQEILTTGYGDRMKGSGVLNSTLEKGLLGKKNGLGFYNYSQEKPVLNGELLAQLNLTTSSDKFSKDEITERLILSMTLESLRAYEEGVAGQQGEEAMGQIDLASIMGFGFPPFRGGILYNAKNELGFKNISKLTKKYQKISPRYAPPEILSKLT